MTDQFESNGENPCLDANAMASIRQELSKWRSELVSESNRRLPPRMHNFETLSGIELPDLLTLADSPSHEQIGLPGQFPFTRGVQATMYRARLWTMRMFAGFGTPELTNARFRYLLEQGQTGLSTAFDFPTLMGYDSDSPRSLGEVGVCSVAVDTLRDMEVLFDSIPLDEVTTSMTINGPAAVLLAYYVALADQRGIARDQLGGTIQNDCLKEFIAQHAWVVPPRPAMRIVTDTIEFCTQELPRWNTVSISGYHIREAGATAAQELAFTIADGIAYVQWCVERGLKVDDFAPRLSFFFDVHSDFFEEVSKLRAARRMWARIMKERFGAKKEASMKLRTHAQTAGVTLTAQQPVNNVVRVTLQALAAALGGVQSLHTNSFDETYALPTEESVKLALRTQQIIAFESGVANTIDPLAGSYFVEWLTSTLEAEAMKYIQRIDDMGGMVSAVEHGYPQQEIASSAYIRQRKIDSGEHTVVGVNQFTQTSSQKIPTFKVDPSVERQQKQALAEVKSQRSRTEVELALQELKRACSDGSNLMPPMIQASRAYATEQEICDVLRDEFGTHTDAPQF